MKIADNGAWLNETNEGHCFDLHLAKAITDFCREKSLDFILDLGCGDGSYVHYFNENVFEILAIGCDGNPHTEKMANAGHRLPFCYTVDLTMPLQLKPAIKPNLILSLEVGEHIPTAFENMYLDNVVKYAKDWIILSWAVPGQTGDGHINCLENGAVVFMMGCRGYIFQLKETLELKEKSSLFWFKNTLMVFKKK